VIDRTGQFEVVVEFQWRMCIFETEENKVGDADVSHQQFGK
jgi:hypothetical protein